MSEAKISPHQKDFQFKSIARDEVFISYSRKDLEFATKLVNRLNLENIEAWFDQNDIPEAVDFIREIEMGIASANCFLFIISKDSVQSKYCQKEINTALKFGKRIIPLLLDFPGDELTNKYLPEPLRRLNWLYFDGEKNTFEKAFLSLKNAINKEKEYVNLHTNILLNALKWVEKKKHNNYLLVGEERLEAEDWLRQKDFEGQAPCEPSDLHCEFICESEKNAFNLMTEVFISYSHEDEAFMEKVKKSLMRNSYTVWTSKTDIKTGVKFKQEINAGIEGASNILYLVSPNSVKSEYCLQELEYADNLNKRIISVMVEETSLHEIPDFISRIQFLDFSGTSQDKELFQNAMDQLVGALDQDKDYIERHKMLLVRALKWRDQNANLSILLRGHNLEIAKSWLKESENKGNFPPTNLHRDFIVESENKSVSLTVDVFVSYSRSDSDFARKLNEKLQQNGKTTWFDQECISAGTDFKKEIYKGIEESENFLFVISPKSINSPYCAEEVAYAASLNKRIITVKYASVNINDLPNELSQVQWIEFRHGARDFQSSFSELLRTIDTDRDYVHLHTKYSKKAFEWEWHQKNSEFLLGEVECGVAENWLLLAAKEVKEPYPTPLQESYIEASKKYINKQKGKAKKQQNAFSVIVSIACLLSVGIAIVSWLGYKNMVDGEEERYKQVLELVGKFKKDQIERSFEQMETNLNYLKSSPLVIQGIPFFNKESQHYDHYINVRPHSHDAKAYQHHYKDLQRIFLPVQESYKYKEIVLADENGAIIFNSNEKGKYLPGETKSKFVYKRPHGVVASCNYITSRNDEEMYVISPPFKGSDGLPVSAIIVINILDYISEITEDKGNGLGKTGEIVVCGKVNGDMKILTPLKQMQFDRYPVSLNNTPGFSFPAVRKALDEFPEYTEKLMDYNQKETLTYYAGIPKVNWGIVVKIEVDEIHGN
ncbi:TIR domain-containing protein [Flexithrix dorotheae]|uniref:TIR domain-containing protein n=1 Tax=Flexithrix dorotheae TaxID=70993 RepID=UPI000376EBD9|nr:TIR domain-containing protein [Flexithrix dorotheae]